MYVSEQKHNLSVYIVEGNLREIASRKITDFQMMLKIDTVNRTFSIFLQDYIKEKYKNVKLGTNFILMENSNIARNNNNIYDYKSISEETYVTDLFNKYKEEILYNVSLAYENLDEEYKNLRFETFEEFQEYSKNNIIKNVIMQLNKYEKTITDKYVQYICVDQKGNCYIFRETAVMKYSLILDTYTIDVPQFVEKYNLANDMEKVGYNIQKCIEAINNKDYSYVYKKLDSNFKENNCKTLAEFETDITTNLYKINKVDTDVNSSNEGNIYIYNLTIINVENENESREMTVIMKLKEGTDFIMSYSFQ